MTEPDRIVEACCSAFGVTLEDVRGRCRVLELKLARAAAETIGRDLGFSSGEMRRALGRDGWRGGWTKRPWDDSQRFQAGVRLARVLLVEGSTL